MWQLRPVDPHQVEALARALHVTPTTARLLWLRGFQTPELARPFWDGREDLSAFHQPVATPGMVKAVARLKAAFAANEPIVIYGDYDCDGVTSAALLYRYLKYGPKAHVEAYLPDRFIDGYGINATAVRRLHAEGKRLILTCDNGISAIEAADVARELGIDLIVTDHHQVPPVLPAAYAIVHPQVEFPQFKDLSGVGVAFLLVVALEGGWSEKLRSMLDLVALGSVADVVPLNGPNRPLVWAGLQHIRSTDRLRPGLKALIGVTGHAKPETLTARNIGFSLAPMINAAGRIEKPSLAFDLLVTNDLAEAHRLADELATINQERREMDRTLVESICADMEREVAHTTDPFLVLADRDFHHGITGIVAGRLKERYRRPVLLLSEHEAGVWKGSGRSLEGCHLYEALASCQDLLLGFGGHAQAAGCSLREENIPALRERLNTFLIQKAWQPPADVTWLDAAPRLADYTPELMAELERLEPCGQANGAPVLGVLNARVIQANADRSGKHLFMKVDDGDAIRDVKAWGKAEEWQGLGPWVHLTLRPKIGTFKGNTELLLQAEALEKVERPAQPSAIVLSVAERRGPDVFDQRGQRDRLQWLRGVLAHDRPVAIYTAEHLPDLALDRVIGPAAVQYWSDRQSRYERVAELVCWERPHSLDGWYQLTAGVSEAVHLAWEGPVVEPELTNDWLVSFYRELASSRHLSWPQLLARPWEATTLMVRAGLEMLRECGLIAVNGQYWELLAAPVEPIEVAGLNSYRAYREAHEFRLLIANGSTAEVQQALAADRPRALAV